VSYLRRVLREIQLLFLIGYQVSFLRRVLQEVTVSYRVPGEFLRRVLVCIKICLTYHCINTVKIMTTCYLLFAAMAM